LAENFFHTKIEFLKGVGPQRAALLNTELQIFNYGDFIQYYPFRYEDRTQIIPIAHIQDNMEFVQLRGRVIKLNYIGDGAKKRLVLLFQDVSSTIELIFFSGAKWIAEQVKIGEEYIVFGKPTFFNRTVNLVHPDIEKYIDTDLQSGFLQPIYRTTEKLKKKGISSKYIGKLQLLLYKISINYIQESLPAYLIAELALCSKKEALQHIHFPESSQWLSKAKFRLKFEELFYTQLKLLSNKVRRKKELSGHVFSKLQLLNEFYFNHLPFQLTEAQKRVIKEIHKDFTSGKQMNRLLQGDVGSGKTMVAFICTLIAIGSDTQACIMAPTEILSTQHFENLKPFCEKLNIRIALLTGSTSKKERKVIYEGLESGEIKLAIGTHALLEDEVKFNNLGLCVIDEQHRFGVAQRARLWAKNKQIFPHILVMTATPIPRTLAMTLYGDLDVSVIDELPAGRKDIITWHKYDGKENEVYTFLATKINEGRQVYIVFPLIEESEKLDMKNLEEGYEIIQKVFPQYRITKVHGRMKAKEKDAEMQLFIKNESPIMVATTVIEVGVNVPNASVMVIRNAERFGLSQLHQLRGRVGRGADQSYCILMTDFKLGKDSRTRIETMIRTNNGFEIADIDLKLRGPGDLMGTQQSGVLDLLITDLAKDGIILQKARDYVNDLLDKDPTLTLPENQIIRHHIATLGNKTNANWARIS
jgi:ATP-dependent DNA helicase RecG